ncbi:acyl-CoA thioesterase [Sphingomonas corticis]|uniref:Thioesterase family protein n=1 Tax=Sphingomonas corticis TaxID=2722791 RepID=A0ABX1CTA7_9SPHN|nr:thioesterase family protein [Sphingomonas corticis]NJR80036.1 thioesterase family protein [Sphingomonas corticis]
MLVEPEHCVGPERQPFLFGGVGLGTAVTAAEAHCERPARWITAQFLSAARPGDLLEVVVDPSRAGRAATQVMVSGSVGGKPVYRAMAALGSGRWEGSNSWSAPPRVPGPEGLERTTHWRGDRGVHAGIEVRVVRGGYGARRPGEHEPDGRLILWARPRAGAIDPAFLAVLADFVPAGLGSALGMHVGGTSLDNTLRVVDVASTDWVLVDVGVEALGSGIAHGSVRLYDRGGAPLAIGSQTMVVRTREA